METVKIHTESITLGQLLKFVNLASSGGEVKALLAEGNIRVDGTVETRRGRKLYAGMTVIVGTGQSYRITV
ncbi:MAG: RNA-binding S4 domain-containing protein [Acholeplasmatales bacterium]|nr:MAG: RNA-binding S4 domain-containing protein [Acholeplasmatales bacterium]